MNLYVIMNLYRRLLKLMNNISLICIAEKGQIFKFYMRDTPNLNRSHRASRSSPHPTPCDPRLFQGTKLCVIQIDLESFQTDKSALKIWTLGVFRWSFGCYWSIDIAQVLHGVSGGLLSRYILLCNAAYIHCLHAYILESNNLIYTEKAP